MDVSRDRTRATPLIERLIAVGADLLRVTEKLLTSLVVLDFAQGSVELRRLAVGGEDIGPEKVADTALQGEVRITCRDYSIRESRM